MHDTSMFLSLFFLHISLSFLFDIKHADVSNYWALILHNFALMLVSVSNKSYNKNNFASINIILHIGMFLHIEVLTRLHDLSKIIIFA